MATKTDRERVLEDELFRYQEAERLGLEEAMERSRQRAQESKAEYEQGLRTATSWREALRNQAILLEKESGLDDPSGHNGTPDTFFGDGAKACRRALELWREIEAARQVEIDELKAKLAGIQDEVKQSVALQLSLEGTRPGWSMVASALHTEDDFNSWLDW